VGGLSLPYPVGGNGPAFNANLSLSRAIRPQNASDNAVEIVVLF
jgi:hypothetical protein